MLKSTIWSAAWFLVGGCWAISFISFIGVITLPIALVATLLLCVWPGPRARAVAAVAGIGVPFLYVAWLNRSGPGTTCRRFANGEACDGHLNPLPWLVIGAGLFAAGVALALHRPRRARRLG
jgi:hypothetical protein